MTQQDDTRGELELITEAIREALLVADKATPGRKSKSEPSTREIYETHGLYTVAKRQLAEDRTHERFDIYVPESEQLLIYRTKQLLLAIDAFRRDTRTGIDHEAKRRLDYRIDQLIDQSFLFIAHS